MIKRICVLKCLGILRKCKRSLRELMTLIEEAQRVLKLGELVFKQLNLKIMQLFLQLAAHQLVLIEIISLLNKLVNFNLGALQLLF